VHPFGCSHDASARIREKRLKAAGDQVFEQEFTFSFFEELGPAELLQVTQTPSVYTTGQFE
jgi:hypothetical protein